MTDRSAADPHPVDLTGDLVASDDALHTSGGWWPRPRDVVVVHGPDAATYLQGQLSQDVLAMGAGTSASSFLLQPDGKVVGWLRVTRVGDDRFVLDVDPGWGQAVLDRLRRFLLRVKVEIESRPATTVPVALAVRAASAASLEAVRPDPSPTLVVADSVAGDLPGFDLVPLTADEPPAPPLARIDPRAYDVVRIERRLPAMGAELGDGTIPAEAGQSIIEASVSFTKGCYTGQELVARVDSRGNNVPRQIRTVRVEGDELPPTGSTVEVGDKTVGTLTTVARSARLGAIVALASLARSVDEGTDLTVRGDSRVFAGVADAVVAEH